MKKLILLLAVIMAVVFSCKKEDSKQIDNPLVGTTWRAPDPVNELILGGNCYHCIYFVSNDKYESYYIRNGVTISSEGEISYVFKNKSVTLKVGGEYHTYVLKTSGTLQLEGTDDSGFYHRYTKQY